MHQARPVNIALRMKWLPGAYIFARRLASPAADAHLVTTTRRETVHVRFSAEFISKHLVRCTMRTRRQVDESLAAGERTHRPPGPREPRIVSFLRDAQLFAFGTLTMSAELERLRRALRSAATRDRDARRALASALDESAVPLPNGGDRSCYWALLEALQTTSPSTAAFASNRPRGACTHAGRRTSIALPLFHDETSWASKPRTLRTAHVTNQRKPIASMV